MVFGGAWSEYNDAQAGREPRDLCRAVIGEAGPGEGRVAADLGCGAGVETKALLAAGWQVIAVDSEPTTPERIARVVGRDDRVEVKVQTLQELDLGAIHLVHASYALPFVDPDHFPAVWQRIRQALAPGGWLAVDLFGDRDEWAGSDGMTFVTRARLEELFEGLDVVRLDEDDEDGQSFGGPKHWHVFHVVARRH